MTAAPEDDLLRDPGDPFLLGETQLEAAQLAERMRTRGTGTRWSKPAASLGIRKWLRPGRNVA